MYVFSKALLVIYQVFISLTVIKKYIIIVIVFFPFCLFLAAKSIA